VSHPVPPDHAWIDWGGDGPVLHFAHANGFPAGSYASLIARLTGSFRVLSMEARPLWSDAAPEGLRTWFELADDLAAGFESRRLRRVVGVGHSLGGVITALAAARQSELFSALILIDPVIFTWPRSSVWRWLKIGGQAHRFPLVRGARERRVRWPDRESVRASYRTKTTFRSWTEECLGDYLTAGLVADGEGGVRLRYPREWEARIFEICPADLWRFLRRIRIPVLFIRGERSETFLLGAANRAIREMNRATVIEVPATSHFLPWEAPDATADEIRRFAAEAY
jgi:pimeloyl-ACP methyl ester carboxylesterase